MLEIETLSVAYGAIQALRDVSLSVGEGSIVTLIGANGAGKTTLLRAISGLLVFGLVGAILVEGAERDPMFFFLLVVLYLGFEVLFFAIVLVMARWVFDHLSGWAVAVANLCAAASMLAYYFTRHRELARRLSQAVSGGD